MSKLDRFIVFVEWEEVFSLVTAMTLPRLVSNHLPIFLGGGEFSSGPKPFRFQLIWLKYPDFLKIIKDWWDECAVSGLLGHIFWLKLKFIEDKLRV